MNSYASEDDDGYNAGSDGEEEEVKKSAIAKLSVWDTAGQEKFRSLTKSYFADAQGAIIVYDSTYKQSFESAKKWADDLFECSQCENLVIALACNKVDDLEGL